LKSKQSLRRYAALPVLLAIAIGSTTSTFAFAADQDADALMLADKAPTTTENASDWKIFLEGAYGGFEMRGDNSEQESHRLSFDVAYDKTFAPGWRFVFADRQDMAWPAQVANQHDINTFTDAYFSWQAQPNTLLDFGRINVRYGVANGYDPTDFFKTGALRSLVSVDPISLKENRQGSVMARVQELWDSGSVTAMLSPKLSNTPNYDGFYPGWNATNDQNRLLIAVSQKISANINPQFLLYKESGQSAQFGLNLTHVIGDSIVAYVEWSGGDSASLLSQALNQQGIAPTGNTPFRNHLSTGLTYTTSNKISVTGEFEYNGGGLDQSDWDAVQHSSPLVYGVYRNWVQFMQEAPTKQAGMLYFNWQDAMLNHLDFSAMERYDAADYSRLSWFEARYHFSHSEFALQWQRYSGSPSSDFGAAPQEQSWLALARYYF
jgi:hypothetical protein